MYEQKQSHKSKSCCHNFSLGITFYLWRFLVFLHCVLLINDTRATNENIPSQLVGNSIAYFLGVGDSPSMGSGGARET